MLCLQCDMVFEVEQFFVFVMIDLGYWLVVGIGVGGLFGGVGIDEIDQVGQFDWNVLCYY